MTEPAIAENLSRIRPGGDAPCCAPPALPPPPPPPPPYPVAESCAGGE